MTFPTAAAARQATTQELIGERLSDHNATVKEEAGLGDRAYWAYTPIPAEYIVLKGSTALGIAAGGMPKPPANYKSELRAATVAVLAKL